jgi:UDP-2,3-diacylglucosamine pyrophosphatase LpxH
MKIFIISDLHLGGRPHPKNGTENGIASPLGSQICHAYAELTQFIDWVASQGSGDVPVELVINGDIVDFLMEDDYQDELDTVPWLPDEARVLEKLKLIIERTRETNQRGPFEAMADLLAQGQLLTFILGNHDVELSLPAVRRYLEEDVFRSGSSGRFRFIYDGEAYVRGDLLIEHGNRYDPWNVIDHSALRQERSMLSRGLGKQMCERESGHFLPPPPVQLWLQKSLIK